MAPHPVNVLDCTVTFLPNQLCKCQICQRVTQDVTPHSEVKAGVTGVTGVHSPDVGVLGVALPYRLPKIAAWVAQGVEQIL